MKIMNEEIGQAVFVIQINDSSALTQLSQWQKSLKGTMEEGQKDTESLASGFDKLKSSIAQLATAGAAFVGLKSGISDVVDSYNQYEAAMNGVRAVASATGNDVTASLGAVKEVTAGGLISQSDAAASIKNLQLYGYSVEEATELIKVMTDAAVYNRQANYSVSEAVRVTTEGIRMENSVLSDASGITKNIVKMYEEYADAIGKTTNDLTQAEKAQAVYNGVLAEGGVFAGNAAGYADTLAGSQQRLDTSIEKVKQTLGGMVAQFSPAVSGLADWIAENDELIVRIGVFTAVLVGGAGLAAALKVVGGALVTAGSAFLKMSAMSKIATLGVLGVVGALASLAASVGVNVLLDNINNTATGIETLGDNSDDADESLDDLGDTAAKTAKQIAKLEQQLRDLDRDYARDLKQIAVKHEESLEKLNQQIRDANDDYRQAIEERNADFNVTLAKQEKSHQDLVDELMTQLNFLQRYNNDYNRQKLLQVQLALEDEERYYAKQTAAQQAEIDLQNAADQAKYEQKLASLQAELDEEQAFYNKHRDELKSVQDVMLLDEIEALNERYEAQKASYNEQIIEAGVSGAKIGANFSDTVKKTIEDEMSGFDLGKFGQDFGTQIMDGLRQGLESAGRGVWDWISQGGIVKNIYDFFFPTQTKHYINGGGGWAEGGYTGRGAVDEVAGIVHRGEYVLPASQVDQNTGTPKVSGVQSLTINLSGVLADSPQAKRQLAADIVRALEQAQQSKLINQGSFA